MNQIIRWINSYPDNAKVFVGVFVMMSLCYLLLFIGLFVDGVGFGHFISRANAGLAGQLIFWAFAAFYLFCVYKTVSTKRVK